MPKKNDTLHNATMALIMTAEAKASAAVSTSAAIAESLGVREIDGVSVSDWQNNRFCDELDKLRSALGQKHPEIAQYLRPETDRSDLLI